MSNVSLRRYAIIILAIIVLAVISYSIIWHFAVTYSTYFRLTVLEFFWYGATFGLLGCLLLVFLGLIGFIVFKPKPKWGKSTLFAIFALLASMGIVWSLANVRTNTALEVFWYSATAGFLATLLFVCIGLIAFLVYKLTENKRARAEIDRESIDSLKKEKRKNKKLEETTERED